MNYPKKVTLIEVGPRDGLQNEANFVPTETKIEFINALSLSGLQYIEVTSFVSPKVIPQLADHTEVFKQIKKANGLHYSALVPNLKGMENAILSGVKEIALFTAVSNTFNQRNINCSIDESLARFEPVIALAKTHAMPIRAYISCVLGCPYEGFILPEKVVELSVKLLKLGVDEISFGDTIGVGTPKQTLDLIQQLLTILEFNQITMHFHDTYGQAVANIHTALSLGVHRFDTAVAGLGGCPYARGATGNVATEDVLYLMHGLNIETGIDIYKIVEAGDKICQKLGKKNQSKVATALLGKR